MARLIAVLLMVVAIWVGAEVYNEGVDGAFGGAFAPADAEFHNPESTPRRAAGGFQRAYNRSQSRVDDLLERPGAAE